MTTGTYSRWTSPSSGSSTNSDVMVTVEAAVAVRDAVYLKASDLYAKANATSMATMPVWGFIVSKPTPTSGLLRSSGDLGGFVGLVAGTQYFAAMVAGQITATPPATPVSGNVVEGLGRAKDTTTLTISVADDDYTVL